jgi:hypothetical protein
MLRKARDLYVGDSVDPAADGKRIKVKLGLENQGRRRNSGMPTAFVEPRRKSRPRIDLDSPTTGTCSNFFAVPVANFISSNGGTVTTTTTVSRATRCHLPKV